MQISAYSKTVTTRKKLQTSWVVRLKYTSQHKQKRMSHSNRYDQDFAAIYPPSLDLALPPNVTEWPHTLFHLQRYQIMQNWFPQIVPACPLDWQKCDDSTTFKVNMVVQSKHRTWGTSHSKPPVTYLYLDKHTQRVPSPERLRIKAHDLISNDTDFPSAKGECLDAEYQLSGFNWFVLGLNS